MANTKLAPLSALEYLAETVKTKLDLKVDTKDGYDLSSNDYTDADKEIVDLIDYLTDPEGEEVVDGWFNGTGSGSGGASNPELEAELAATKAELENTQFQLATVNSQLAGKDAQISSLTGQLESKSTQLTEAQDNLATKTAEYNTLSAEYDDMSSSLEGWADELAAIIGA